MSVISPLLFRAVSAEYRGSATVTLYTDLPDTALALRETIYLPYSVGRVALPPTALSGTTRARVFRVKTECTFGAVVIYRIGFYVRKLGRTPSDWYWHWIAAPGSTDEYTDLRVPIPPTPEEWQQLAVPIPETPEAWDEVQAPIPSSPDEQFWHDLPMDD